MKYYILLLAFLFLSCQGEYVTKEEYQKLTEKNYAGDPVLILKNVSEHGWYAIGDSKEAHVIISDSCEYLFGERGGDGGPIFTHKGNCKNCRNYLRKLLNK